MTLLGYRTFDRNTTIFTSVKFHLLQKWFFAETDWLLSFQESGIGEIFERLKCLIFRILKGHFSQVSVAINIIYIYKSCSVSFLRYWNVLYFGNWNKSFSEILIVLVSGDWIELNVLLSINKDVSYSRDGNMLFLADGND